MEIKSSSTPTLGTKKLLPEPMRRESREWKPAAQFYKPLLIGWKREAIYGREPATQELTAKPEQIVYHAPPNPGCKARTFRSLAELGSFLSSASSILTLHNFSFRKELMNAPKNQEISHAFDEEVTILSKSKLSPAPLQSQHGVSAGKPSKKKLRVKQPTGHEPGLSPFSHGPGSWKSSQQHIPPKSKFKC